jgi:hypothetical protein
VCQIATWLHALTAQPATRQPLQEKSKWRAHTQLTFNTGFCIRVCEHVGTWCLLAVAAVCTKRPTGKHAAETASVLHGAHLAHTLRGPAAASSSSVSFVTVAPLLMSAAAGDTDRPWNDSSTSMLLLPRLLQNWLRVNSRLASPTTCIEHMHMMWMVLSGRHWCYVELL